MSLWRYAVSPITSPRVYNYSVNHGRLSSTYRSLTPKTRVLFGVGVMAWATIGLWTSPQVENALGMQPSKEEQDALDRKLQVRVSRAEPDGKEPRVN